MIANGIPYYNARVVRVDLKDKIKDFPLILVLMNLMVKAIILI